MKVNVTQAARICRLGFGHLTHTLFAVVAKMAFSNILGFFSEADDGSAVFEIMMFVI